MTDRHPRLAVLLALVINAIVQAALVLPDPTPGWTPLFVAGAVLSGLAWLAAYAVVAARQVGTGVLSEPLRRNGLRFAAWTAALAVVVFIALIPLNGILGVLVLIATPYVPIAAMSGAANPLLADLAAIRRRPLGLLWRVIAFGLLVLVVLVVMALTAFFVGGPAAALVNGLALGLVGWLVTWSFGREYRRAT